MSWTTIRLELARTPAFPNGSAARSYVLRLPLGSGGLIDEREYRIHPELATARRFWPNEPDRHGTRSEEHTSELQSLMRISYAVFCLKKKRTIKCKQEAQH